MKASSSKRALLFMGMLLGASSVQALSISLDVTPFKIHPPESLSVAINVSGLHSSLGDGRTVDSVLGAFSLDFLYNARNIGFNQIQWTSALGDATAGQALTQAILVKPGQLSLSLVSLLESRESCGFCVGPYLEDTQSNADGTLRDSFTLAVLGGFAPLGGFPALPAWPPGGPVNLTLFSITNVILSDGDGNRVPVRDAETGEPLGPAGIATPPRQVPISEPGSLASLALLTLCGWRLHRRDGRSS